MLDFWGAVQLDRESEFGSYESSSYINAMLVRDSVLYTGGINSFIDSYILSEDRTSATYITNWNPVDIPYIWRSCQKLLLSDNILFASTTDWLRAFNVSDIHSIDYIGFYWNDLYYVTDLCVIDSFVITLGTSSLAGAAKVSVIKYDEEASGINCSFNLLPDGFDFDIYPNPFNSSCRIDIRNYNSSQLDVRIYNLKGRVVLDKPNISRDTFIWDASGEASGVYIVVLRQGDNTITKRVMLLK